MSIIWMYLKGSAKRMGTSLESSSGIVASYCTMSNWGPCVFEPVVFPPKSEGNIEDELTPAKRQNNVEGKGWEGWGKGISKGLDVLRCLWEICSW